MAGVAEMGKSHTINKENLFKNRGGNRGGTDRGGPRPPAHLKLWLMVEAWYSKSIVLARMQGTSH